MLFTGAFLLLVIAHPSIPAVNSTAPTSQTRRNVGGVEFTTSTPVRRLRLELGVLVALLVSFVTVPLLVPHVVAAIAWVALTAVHVVRRRRLYVGLLRSAGSGAPGRGRRIATTTA